MELLKIPTMKKQRKTSLDKEIPAHHAALFNYAKFLTKNTDLAEDLVQDTYVKALVYQESFEEGTNLKNWLLRILHNLFIDEVRRQKSFLATDRLPDNILTAVNEGARSLAAEDIRKVFNTLPDSQKEMIEYRANGYKYEDIAKEENIPISTVWSRLYHSKKNVQKKFRKDNYGE
jgi:RNA polymerase sigma-70 factor (ECF subfamily)